MSWAPNDLLTDKDLLAYERTLFETFSVDDWAERRQKAIEDWLFPLLEARGFTPQRLRTRYAPAIVLGQTSAVYTDLSSAAQDEDGINVATVLATPASDALYVGFPDPFRGLSLRMLDDANAVDSSLRVRTWTDGWVVPDDVQDDTREGSVSLSKGGAVTWRVPENIVARSINGFGPAFWAKVTMTVTPTAGTKIGPLSVIRRSRLCAPVTFRTLASIFREAPTGQDGPWREKAEWYEAEAERAWLRVADHLGGEFDTDGDDAIDGEEATQTTDSVTGGGWSFERA